jgi:hypothetical protein
MSARPVLVFLGDKFTDPILTESFKTFLPYGYGTQRNLSPSTLSLDIVYFGYF